MASSLGRAIPTLSPPELPAHFLPRPAVDCSAATLRTFADLRDRHIAGGYGAAIPYCLNVPKWQFLCWLTDSAGYLLHGSGDSSVTEFQPRQSNDIDEFGNRCAVYAASDGIWPIYFAIADRERSVTSLVNGAFRLIGEGSPLSDPFYFFSVNEDALARGAWRNGSVYVLPRDGFELQPEQHVHGLRIHIPQWAGPTAVRPLARIDVMPEDFPFLGHVRGHDPESLRERARQAPAGFPWL